MDMSSDPGLSEEKEEEGLVFERDGRWLERLGFEFGFEVEKGEGSVLEGEQMLEEKEVMVRRRRKRGMVERRVSRMR